jgi:ADP-ribosylglycohydrolase
MDLRQRIRATLYGQALGDAWAMPVYFTMEQTRQKFGEWIDTFLPAPDDHPVHKGLIAGRVTDDSEQAFAIAESIIAQGAVTVRGVADALIAWYDRVDGDNSPYVGPSTRRGVTALKRGADPNTTGTWGDTDPSRRSERGN